MRLKNTAFCQALDYRQHVRLDNVLYVGWQILKMRSVAFFFITVIFLVFHSIVKLSLSFFSMNANVCVCATTAQCIQIGLPYATVAGIFELIPAHS